MGFLHAVKTGDLATTLWIPLTSFDQVQGIDVSIDGADEFDPQLSLIKGGGGALLHEKVVASASRQMMIVTDSHKQVPVLGKLPLPIEAVAFAEPLVRRKVEALGRRLVSGNQTEDRLVPTKVITSSTAASARSPIRHHSLASSVRCLESWSTVCSLAWPAWC